MVPLPFAASAFCFGSVPKAGRSGYLIYKVSTLRNVRYASAVLFTTAEPYSFFRPPFACQKPQIPAAPKEQQGFATTITHRCASVRLRHMLALPAKLREIDTDDVYAVKRLLAVFIPDLLEVGRELIHQQMQCTHHLFGREMDMRLTPQNDALILCGEVARQQMHTSNDAERHLRMLLQSPQLMPLRSTMDVDGVVAVPYIVQWHTIPRSVDILHRQHTIFTLSQKL